MGRTFASLFTGGGGADYSARRLGYTHLWGVEYDPKIAGVAELNDFPVMVADVCAVDFSALTAPYWLHMSPTCTRASIANPGAGETIADINLAAACIRAAEALRSPRISLENVWAYREFESFRGSTQPGDKFNFEGIVPALRRNGYAVDYWHLNAADYGVPQTRKRLCLVASKDHQPRRPLPTHEKNPDPFDMFALLPWVGWYSAIADLIPSLPDSQFAPWQMKRLPLDLKTSLIAQGGYKGTVVMAGKSMPSFTLTANTNQTHIRAFMVHPTEMRRSSAIDAGEPCFTVISSGFTPLAFIIGGGNTNTTEDRPRTPRYDDQPAFTLSQSSDRDRAYVGRVVKMTPRALARFNGLGDDYLLPTSNTLACTVLGNMHILQGPMMEPNP